MISLVLVLSALTFFHCSYAAILSGEDDFSSYISAGGVDPRIIGGQMAEKGQFPWHVSFSTDETGFCNGALVHPKWVLTTAKCVVGVTNFSMTFGMVDLFDVDSEPQYLDSDTAIAHPEYNSLTMIHDIALIWIGDGLNITTPAIGGEISTVETIRKITCKEAEEELGGLNATLSGWGKNPNINNDPVQTHLYYVDLVLLTQQSCTDAFGIGNIFSSQLCSSGRNTVGACDNDEGSPLVVYGEDGEAILVGLASFASPTGCDRRAPTVYTRVGEYLDWIHETMGDDCDDPVMCEACNGAWNTRVSCSALLAVVVMAVRNFW